MPCTCKQKVDRGQAKIQCVKCKEIFHLKCVNLSEADADFFRAQSDSAFYCLICAKVRRNSIRSPPPPRITAESLSPVDISDPVVAHLDVPEKQQSPSVALAGVTQKQINGRQNSKESESMLSVVLNELVGLRAENVRVISLLRSLHDDKQKLLAKVDNLQAELLSMQSKLDNCITAVNPAAVNSPVHAEDDAAVISRANIHSDCSAILTSSTSVADDAAASIVNSPTPTASLASALMHCSSDSVNKCSPAVAIGASANVILRSHTAQSTNSYASALLSNIGSDTTAARIVNATPKVDRCDNQRSIVGTKTNSELKVAARMQWLHLSSFKPSVTTDNITDYVSKNANINKSELLCYKLVKNDADPKSLKRVNFKLGAPDSLCSKLLSSDLWPVGVNVRPFRFFPKAENQQKAQ